MRAEKSVTWKKMIDDSIVIKNHLSKQMKGLDPVSPGKQQLVIWFFPSGRTPGTL